MSVSFILHNRSSYGVWRSSPAALLASLDAIVLIYLAWKEDLAAGGSCLTFLCPRGSFNCKVGLGSPAAEKWIFRAPSFVNFFTDHVTESHPGLTYSPMQLVLLINARVGTARIKGSRFFLAYVHGPRWTHIFIVLKKVSCMIISVYRTAQQPPFKRDSFGRQRIAPEVRRTPPSR